MSILSISDVITNSSSEVFCTITHENKDTLREIYNKLSEVISTDGWGEEQPILCNNIDVSSEDEDAYLPNCIYIDMPYSAEGVYDFYKAGLEAILDKYFEDYTINYE